MIKRGILNPGILDLLARVRHTNTVVIADRGFPFRPGTETVDISLTDDIPTVLDVLRLVIPEYVYGKAYLAEEFKVYNDAGAVNALEKALAGIPLIFEPHETAFKKRVDNAIGIIRTGDTIQYANIILESA